MYLNIFNVLFIDLLHSITYHMYPMHHPPSPWVSKVYGLLHLFILPVIYLHYGLPPHQFYPVYYISSITIYYI